MSWLHTDNTLACEGTMVSAKLGSFAFYTLNVFMDVILLIVDSALHQWRSSALWH